MERDRDRYDEEKTSNSYTEIYVWGGDHYGQLGLGHKYTGKTYPAPKICSFNLIIREVSCGEEHAAFITYRGHIYTMGSNSQGRLGIGNRSIRQSSSPCLVEDCAKFKCRHVSCGWGHTIAVMESGDVYTWGVGEHGALGTGSTETAWSPAQINLDNQVFIGVKTAAAGSRHSAFISEFGNLYTCGSGDAGQLGTGKRDRELSPVQVTLISEKVQNVACGIFHTLMLTERGRVYSTGGNTFGQLGIGNKKNTNIPTRIKDFDRHNVVKIACGHHSAALTDRGDIFIWGTGIFGEYLTPVKFSQNANQYKDLAIGGFFGASVDQMGSVWTWGSNTSGELGQGDFEPRVNLFPISFLQGKQVQNVSCGGSFVIALGETKRDRSVSSPQKQQLDRSVEMSQTYPRQQQSGGGGGMHGSGFYHKHSQHQSSQQQDYDDRRYQDDRREATPEVGMRRSIGARDPMRSSDKHSKSPYRPTGGAYSRTEEADYLVRQESPYNSVIRDRVHRGGKSQQALEQQQRDSISNLEREKAGNRIDDPFVELLMKQKSLLENNLKYERDERRSLENQIIDLKKRMRDLQEGPGGLSELSSSLEKQTKRYDDLRRQYDEECVRREKTNLELNDAQRNVDQGNHRMAEKERSMQKVEEKMYNLNVELREKNDQIDDLTLQNSRKANEIETNQHEISRLRKTLQELTGEYEKANHNIRDLEKLHGKEVEEKRFLEGETNQLGDRLNDLMQRLDDNIQTLDREQKDKFRVEEELADTKQREAQAYAKIQEYIEENARLRDTLEKTIEQDQIKSEKMKEERDQLHGLMQRKNADNDELRARVSALEQNLVESETKNKKLVDLLNQEIEKQAEDFKKRALTTIFAPAKKIAENIAAGHINEEPDEGIDYEQAYEEQRAAMGHGIVDDQGGYEQQSGNLQSQLGDFQFRVTNADGEPKPMDVSNRYSAKQAYSREESPDKLRRVIQEDDYEREQEQETEVERRSYQPPMPEIQMQNMNQSEVNEQQQQEHVLRGSMITADRASQEIDESRKKLSMSANKLMNILELKEDTSAPPSVMEKVRYKTPTKGTPVKIEGQYPISATKARTPSLLTSSKKVASTQDSSKKASRASPMRLPQSNIRGDETPKIHEQFQGQEYMSNLKDVKDKLANLQRNKVTLENKMLEFEKKLQKINK